MTARRSARRIEGKITLVQEDRFRLHADDGRGMLFILGRRSGVSLADLSRLGREGRRVAVEFEGEPEMGGVATRILIDAPACL